MLPEFYPARVPLHPLTVLVATLRQRGFGTKTIAAVGLIQAAHTDLSLLPDQRRLSIKALATSLGMSHRALLKDLEQLEAMELVNIMPGYHQVEGLPVDPVLEHGGALSPLRRAGWRC